MCDARDNGLERRKLSANDRKTAIYGGADVDNGFLPQPLHTLLRILDLVVIDDQFERHALGVAPLLGLAGAVEIEFRRRPILEIPAQAIFRAADFFDRPDAAHAAFGNTAGVVDGNPLGAGRA